MATDKKQALTAIGILAVLSIYLFFVTTNVNPQLGLIYNGLAILSIGLIIADQLFGKRTIKLINRNVSWGKALLWGIGGYIALIASVQLTSLLAEFIPLTEILSLLGASAPVFSNSALINFFTFGGVIAFLETYALFIALPDLMASIFNIEISKRNILNPKVLTLITAISTIFLLLHVTAKGIGSEAILILVFLMAFISLVITFMTNDSRPALILHIVANSIAATSIFAIIKLSSVLTVFG